MPWPAAVALRACLVFALLLGSAGVRPESRLAPSGQSASAGLDFRIIIPPVIRVLENSHPDQLEADAQGRLGGAQTLVVLSNMKRGFCITLRRQDGSESAPLAWRLRALQADGMSMNPAGGGWRLCAARPGRYALRLQHEFESAADASAQAMAWPVATDLAAL